MNILEHFLGGGYWKFWEPIRQSSILRKIFWWKFQYKYTIKTLESGYKDPDDVILHAAFEELIRFYEGVKDFKCYTTCRTDKLFWRKICNLYYWWTKVRPARQEPELTIDMDKVYHFEDSKEMPGYTTMIWHESTEEYKQFQANCSLTEKLHKEWEIEDTKMLHRLVYMRGTGRMWI